MVIALFPMSQYAQKDKQTHVNMNKGLVHVRAKILDAPVF